MLPFTCHFSAIRRLLPGLCLAIITSTAAGQVARTRPQNTADSLVSHEISLLLTKHSLSLNYPKTVQTYYKGRGHRPCWSLANPDQAVWESLLLFDRAIQYGLNRQRFHPREINYDQLAKLKDAGIRDQAKFELLLTDAILTFINHLHYGQLNPKFPAPVLESQKTPYAASVLHAAFSSNSFCEVIEKAQPDYEEYEHLQEYLRLVAGQYVGDNFQVSEAVIRQVAANLERWRWEKSYPGAYIAINIPSYTLAYNEGQKQETFRVIVGKPGNPTPIIESSITHFITAPGWNVPKKIFLSELLPRALKDAGYLARNNYELYGPGGTRLQATRANLQAIRAGKLIVRLRQMPGCDNSLGSLVFRFPNRFSIYLHDTPSKYLFEEHDRALSHGCVRLEQPERLAELLFDYDGDLGPRKAAFRQAFASQRQETFFLDSPIPIVSRYFTCSVEKGELTVYKDIYQRDQPVSEALLGSSQELFKHLERFVNRRIPSPTRPSTKVN